MQTDIDQNTLVHLAELAHLKCSCAEFESLTKELRSITAYFASLQSVKTDDCGRPQKNPSETTPLRDDCCGQFEGPSLLKLAPDRIGDLYRVPSVFSQEHSS